MAAVVLGDRMRAPTLVFVMGGVVPLLGWLDYVPFKEEILDKKLLDA